MDNPRQNRRWRFLWPIVLALPFWLLLATLVFVAWFVLQGDFWLD